MNPKLFLWLLTALLLFPIHRAEAQQPEKIRWIGYFTGSGSTPNHAFVQALRDLGYVEGKNIGFVFRSAEGHSERYDDLASELVRMKVDIIVSDFTSPALAAKKATSTIPIVMTNGTDPIGTGLVTSLGSARRKCNRANKHQRRVRRKRFAVAQGDRAETQSCGHTEDGQWNSR